MSVVQEKKILMCVLSDLLSDFVTLYTFKMSRKVPDTLYPYGYGKQHIR
jgi:divalent metal cation (Fe/Co/Zn/Cd) transporter